MSLPARQAGAAGARAARKAVNVLRSLQQSTPAGAGVEMTSLVEALPYFGLAQLIDCASHFGQRGRVVGPVAAEVAAEIGRRLRRSEEGAEKTGLSDMARNLNAKEVTTAFYAFSKLSPQMPEYRAFYDAVADGLVERRWELEGMKAALIGTALADTETRLSDALPAVVKPVLRELAESQEARDAMGADELRFLIHAAVRLPELSALQVEALASCTEQLVGSTSFSVQAHLAVSWLRLKPPASAKGVHLDVLETCCKMLATHAKSHYPAHPLPREGLAPAIADLLAREAEKNAPPLTPPVLQNITKGLVQISWGLQRYQLGHNPSRSLSIDDWAEIVDSLMTFCEGHLPKNRSTAPLWAREALYHVLWRAQQRKRRSDEAPEHRTQLSSLRILLRLLKRHKPSPVADPEFFQWASRLVVLHQKDPKSSTDAVELMTLVSDLVPFLPEDQRSALARLVMTRTESPEIATATARTASASIARRLLDVEAESDNGRAVAVAGRVAWSSTKTRTTVALDAKKTRLWNLLATSPETVLTVQEPKEELVAESATLQAKAEEQQPEIVAAERAAQVEEGSARAPPSATVEELQQMLQGALQRVEALESRLQDQERDVANKHQLDDACDKSSDESGGWLTSILTAPVEQIQPSAAAMTLHLRRSFSFEDFRRSQSARLQSERLRVAVPPDHFPLWPITMKK
ncbi:unnamed protein product [Durusdinium trenchii]|uniref:Uncharacterized protein n=2 Tax=Durusdinium trenchii TaxID=1381693 RepID=A0ABP0NZW5_9DINO